MKVAVYLSAVPQTKGTEKVQILKNFGHGVSYAGDTVEYVTDYKIVDADVAIMQGFVHRDISSAHLHLRRNILDNHKKTIIIDSNLFQFADPEKPNYYLRYSLNGVFPTTGFYFDNNIDYSRWPSIQQKLNLFLRDYRKEGTHILLCLQRIGGWSMGESSVQQWMDNIIRDIRQHTDRPIVVRRHPGDRQQQRLVFPKGVVVSSRKYLIEDFKNCWATITYNSSPGVASLIRGIPTFVTDPMPQHSQTYPVCNTNFKRLENPKLDDREAWIHRLSQFHWNTDELINGSAWRFMRDRLQILESSPC
jgi:hypothetical protein